MPNRRLQVVVVGLSHLTAPIALRERCACSHDDAVALAADAGVAESLVVSTCNRVEAYAADADPEAAADRLLGALAARAGVSPAELAPHAFVHLRDAASRHLCRVAAGLESMVLGETQIAAQLRRAVRAAREAGTCGPVLERLAGTALAAGKRARARLAPSGAPSSMADAAIRAAGGAARLRDTHVLVLGAGEIAAEVLRALDAVRPTAVAVANRSTERAAALAVKHGALVVGWERLAAAVHEADVVIAATAAPRALVTAALLEGAPEKPRVFVDLGVPRNVHEDVRQATLACVMDVDTLRGYSRGANDRGDACITHGREAADAEVERWVTRFAVWQRARANVTTIRHLRADAERVMEAELARALAKLSHLGPREQAVVRAMGARLVNKLLHQPLVALAGAPEAAELRDPARRLFGLDREPAGRCPVTGLTLEEVARRDAALVEAARRDAMAEVPAGEPVSGITALLS